MDLEQALERIAELETETSGLKEERAALLRKRDELLGKLTKLKKFEAYGDVDIEELIRLRDAQESGESETKTKYEEAYKQANAKLEARLAAIEADRKRETEEREAEKATVARERIRAAAILEFSKPDHGVFNPEQLYRLVGDQIKLDDSGSPIVGDEYSSLPLADYLKELKTDAAYQNQFKASGASGSGVTPSLGAGTIGSNPWKSESFNLTQQALLVKNNPQLAAKMKAAAGA